MNTSFMRSLAERLEHMCWIEVVPEECRIVEFFDSMDGFIMSSDLKFWRRPPGFVFGDEDYFIGSVEEWAVQLVQERQGYYKDYGDEADREDSWVHVVIDDEFTEREVWGLACRALGLGERGDDGIFVADEGQAHALLRPSGLYGRMRGVTPQMAAEVLRLCAGGVEPKDAWALVGQVLRDSRLRELAGVVQKSDARAPVRQVEDWSYAELRENLRYFSMEAPYSPWLADDGAWCGGLAVWAYALYGATGDLSFGPAFQRNLPVVSSTLLGLTVMEGLALFEAGVSPKIQGELEAEEFRKMLTPDSAAEALRNVAEGVFPSAAWDVFYESRGLELLLDGTDSRGGRSDDAGC